jgi:hypothetical protein
MRKAITILPDLNFYLLEKLIFLLRQVHKYEAENDMSSENLAEIFRSVVQAIFSLYHLLITSLSPILFSQNMIEEDEGKDLICVWIDGHSVLFQAKPITDVSSVYLDFQNV